MMCRFRRIHFHDLPERLSSRVCLSYVSCLRRDKKTLRNAASTAAAGFHAYGTHPGKSVRRDALAPGRPVPRWARPGRDWCSGRTYRLLFRRGLWGHLEILRRRANWEPIFDKEDIASIGSIAVAPSDHNIIYAGSGEACI